MSSYIGPQPTFTTRETRQEFVATASQTTFNTNQYSVGFVDCYLNGVKLSDSDFTATNGSQVVLGTGATAGDILAVVLKKPDNYPLSIDDRNIEDGVLSQAKISNLTTDLAGKASLTADQTFTGGNRGTVTVANTASFDMNTTNNFSCTPTANYTITFTNITAGQSGNIYVNNATNYTASKAASVKLASADLFTLSATGEYWLSYFAPSASVVLVSVTAALS